MRAASAIFMSVIGMAATTALADVTMPHIFSSHMVLQQKKPIAVWGKADPGEAVSVTFAGQTAKTTADGKGTWKLELGPVEAKTDQVGQTLTVSGKNNVSFDDVLVGEVWVCSGQSNMAMAVGSAMNSKDEVASAKYPQIRLFTVPNVVSLAPLDDCNSEWKVCSPETISSFSAVGYFFGRHLHEQLKVPVGLINSSWGGTVAQAWTSEPVLRAKLPEFSAELDKFTVPGESATVAQRQAAVPKLHALEADLKAAEKFAVADLDDSAWKTMTMPGNWETQGLREVDGIVWFRKTIDIPAAWAGKEITLRPGPIDEVDNAWFNGVYVGGKGSLAKNDTSFWNVPREYHVPGAHVKAGKNVIAIRILDSFSEGGMRGAPASTMFVELADGSDKTHIPLAGDWRYYPEFVLPIVPPTLSSPNQPAVLYNGMINPLIPYGIQGAIWYQGESNADRAKQYQTLLPAMITDWRTRWNQGEFPFLIVQLANFMDRADVPTESVWAELREAQTLTSTSLPKVGLALAIDIGDAKDIHPSNKQDLGYRLGLAARSIAYGQNIPFSGPLYKSMAVKDGKVELSFDHTNQGLVAKDGELKGFAIAGADRKFVWATAKIEGDKVIVSAEGVKEPVAVRYAWANNPECNLYNGAGLPAVPFRTDRD